MASLDMDMRVRSECYSKKERFDSDFLCVDIDMVKKECDFGDSKSKWCSDRGYDRHLENYMLQNFNIEPVYEKSAVLPSMVPGTKNFADSMDIFNCLDIFGKHSSIQQTVIFSCFFLFSF